MDDIRQHPAYRYAQKAVEGKLRDVDGEKTEAPEYVKKQCRIFLNLADGKDPDWYVCQKKVEQIDKVLRLLIMPKGLKAGQTLYTCTEDYQWLFYVAILCVVSRKDENLRKYKSAILEIGRKNFKTYTIGTLFIILFLLEPDFSMFYSVAPDGSLSREVREAISETLKASPLIYEFKGRKRWKILRDYIEFLPTETKYFPLNYTNSRFDGKLPNAFLADEVGALPNSYAIEAMFSGQLNIKNKLGCIISTKYPTANNPFEDEVKYAKQVIDGITDDPDVFALLYEPDNKKDWATDDEILRQANPVSLKSREIWEDLLKRRARAIEKETARENFITKHCNIIYQGAGTESYIPIEYVQKCRTDEPIDWEGRTVYVGVDLSQTSDNTAVVMASRDADGNIICLPMCFIPEDRIEEKSSTEKVDYRAMIDEGLCIACGDFTIDYGVVEDYVFGLEGKYGVSIAAIGYDRYNALSSAQKWADKYNCVEVRQHSDTLHAPMKYLYEQVMAGRFRYEKNRLLEDNFQNVRVKYDATLRMWADKKHSNGKIDEVMGLIDAVYLMQQDSFNDDFIVQVM